METREGPRIGVSLSVISTINESDRGSISLAGGNSFECRACDISAGGIGLITKYYLPKGLLLELEIEGVRFGLQGKFKVKGEVIHCKNIPAHGYKCGVKFTEIANEYRAAISQFISVCERRKDPRLDLSSGNET